LLVVTLTVVVVFVGVTVVFVVTALAVTVVVVVAGVALDFFWTKATLLFFRAELLKAFSLQAAK